MSATTLQSNQAIKIKEIATFFAIVVASALCLSFILSLIIYRFGVPDHPQKYLLTSLYISFCVGLPIAVIASQNQFRLMVHRDPLETLSATDTLSGLLTRRFFLTAASQHIQSIARADKLSGIVVFDIDGFRQINDTYGNLLGDKVLMLVAKMAREELRSRQDLITRWWGDEFVIVLYGASGEETRRVADRIRERIYNTPIDLDGEEVLISASFGISPLSKYDSIESALSRADQAMALAKQRGKNRICSWSMVKLAA
ncbi:MAG: GGDEF domain-containing protein [Pseudomonadota bacterium]